MGNTESLPYFKDGTVFIELEGNSIGIVSGDEISGTVHLNLEKKIKCTHFTVALMGYDVASYMQKANSNYYRVIDSTPICNQEHVLEQILTLDLEPGQFSYPFTIKIPDWLPPSLIVATDDNNECRGEIKYKLLAQIVPLDDENWADKKNKVSKLRGERLLIVQKPQCQVPAPSSL